MTAQAFEDREAMEWREMPFISGRRHWAPTRARGDDVHRYAADFAIGAAFAAAMINHLREHARDDPAGRFVKTVMEMTGTDDLPTVEHAFLLAIGEFIASGRIECGGWFDMVPRVYED